MHAHVASDDPFPQLTHNVTYGGWAEAYDRLKAKRMQLERRERLEMEREERLRRQKAKEEFQV